MSALDSIAAVLAIATTLSGAFSYIVIRPLQKAIDVNSNVLTELKKSSNGVQPIAALLTFESLS